jgi:hypothetical protein
VDAAVAVDDPRMRHVEVLLSERLRLPAGHARHRHVDEDPTGTATDRGGVEDE